jgi:hypothetical protein
MKSPATHMIAGEGRPNSLQLGVTYMWKLRSETLSSQPATARYSCKVWPAGMPEPSTWNVRADMPARSGSVLLVADFADVTYGDVEVRPLAP